MSVVGSPARRATRVAAPGVVSPVLFPTVFPSRKVRACRVEFPLRRFQSEFSVVEFGDGFDGLLSSPDTSHILGLEVSGGPFVVGKCWQVTSEDFQEAEVAELADAPA
jgi:hypothetical protein